MANPKTGETDLDFWNKRINLVSGTTKENVFRQKLSRKFQTDRARENVLYFTIKPDTPI